MLTIQLSELGGTLFNLALDPDKPEEEWHEAAVNFFQLARGARAAILIEQGSRSALAGASSVVPFERYVGRSVWWMVSRDPSYARWCLNNLKKIDPDLRVEIEAELKRQGK